MNSEKSIWGISSSKINFSVSQGWFIFSAEFSIAENMEKRAQLFPNRNRKFFFWATRVDGGEREKEGLGEGEGGGRGGGQ